MATSEETRYGKTLPAFQTLISPGMLPYCLVVSSVVGLIFASLDNNGGLFGEAAGAGEITEGSFGIL